MGLLLALSSLKAQISPGPLTKAHKEFEGISNCTKCHELGKAVISPKCLDCHGEIKSLQNNKQGYHAHPEVLKAECFTCHSEHHGENFRIIHFDTENFDHNKTGYVLNGAHKELKCISCHTPKLHKAKMEKKLKPTSFLGLETNCISCHKDVHKNSLGVDCLSCHTQTRFKPAQNFNHNNAQFKLTGKHKDLECISCHKIEEKQGEKVQKFKGIPFKNCLSCHVDVHKGKFGNNCTECHTTNAFTQIINKEKFDHSKTSYPLLGLHKQVACASCHTNGIKKRLAFNSCNSCHTDFHKGAFKRKQSAPDCNSCHTVYGFSPATYTLIDHQKSRFKLEGAHLATPCIACHKPNNNYKFTFKNKQCSSCHSNPHPSDLKNTFFKQENCLSCHTQTRWDEIEFDHGQTHFPLEGKHINTACKNCHFNENKGQVSQTFAGLNMQCLSCHADIHEGQFDKSGKADCVQCHNPHAWKPSTFNHNSAQFVLEGAHKKLECGSCHIKKSTQTTIHYQNGKIKCTDCHSS